MILCTRPLVIVTFAGVTALSMSSAAAESAPTGATAVYEVPAKGPVQMQRLIEAGFDVLAQTRAGTLHVAAPLAQADVLRQLCGRANLLRAPATGPQIAALDANLGAYRTYSEATAVLQALVAAHPSRAALVSLGQSIEMRTIHALKISDSVATDESEPEVLFMGCHHARELMSVEIPLQFAEYLLAQYGTNAQVTQFVDTREIWIVPIVNPDGYVYVQNNHTGNNWDWWRKNRRNNGGGSFGVDLNRNYGYNWGFDNIGSSGTTTSGIYRGTAAFSEPETRAIRDFCNSRDFVMWLSYHSYSELLLYPWGYTLDYTADHETFLALGEEMAASNGYLAGNPAMGAIYRTNGGSDDWGYGDIVSKPAIYGFTPEVGSFADSAFAPPENLIGPYFDLLLPMNMKCLELAGNPQQVLGPAPATITSVAATPAAELVLQWTGNVGGDPNPALTYELEGFQMQGFQAAGADAPSPWLNLAGGFAPSSARVFSGSGSYYSGAADNTSATVTVAAPYQVTAATQTFSCRMWYAIELDYDYAYVEVSEDQGIIWRPIAGNVTTNVNPNGANLGYGITGTSGGWVQATFSLADYLGQEILLRLRYVTDGSALEEGLYVDAFDGVPTFGLHGPIASGIASASHTFSPAALGTWAYRVRGIDAQGDTSRWSLGFDVLVDDAVDATRLPPLYTALAQNVPNPFNPFTTLVYRIGATHAAETARRVRLEIFDATSRRVMTLVDAALLPGQHRASWNGADAGGMPLPSGVYFARLQVDGEPPMSRKLLLLQ